MNLREALIQQAPSLALQRAAADEIARLDDLVHRLRDALSDSHRPDQHNPYAASELRPELFE